ncbi:hypothetical protein EII34_09635 [Arachnia propionica]|uniref:Transcriptional regulator, AbiEi antitoxin, Type IV TA system n=1 Tax=Arachnia propionica TaxID=1750 RepID=A0A3P1T5G4_9ACTN|nr:type IV toxin-antitoxin system AbiEi family antitoxin domain-containing protein [Arachnia propionica]RRD04558.1 hypothetical protein EII34_09635 [Arachnia propionica]
MTNNDVWTRAHLTSLGLTPSQLDRQLEDGTLTRLRRGFYSHTEALDSREGHLRRIRATAEQVDDTSVFSHVSAAVLHGLPVPFEALETVTMTRRSPGHGDRTLRLLVRRTAIEDAEITSIDNLPVTTLARTTTDLARTSDFGWALVVADAALARGATRQDLLNQLALHPRLHGTSQARRVIHLADERAESPAESFSRLNIMRAGLPEPQLQVEIIDANGEVIARPDFLWPEFGVAGEVDGMIKYRDLLKPGQAPSTVILAEKRRDVKLEQHGYRVIHWGWAEATNASTLAHLLGPALRTSLNRRA